MHFSGHLSRRISLLWFPGQENHLAGQHYCMGPPDPQRCLCPTGALSRHTDASSGPDLLFLAAAPPKWWALSGSGHWGVFGNLGKALECLYKCLPTPPLGPTCMSLSNSSPKTPLITLTSVSKCRVVSWIAFWNRKRALVQKPVQVWSVVNSDVPVTASSFWQIY